MAVIKGFGEFSRIVGIIPIHWLKFSLHHFACNLSWKEAKCHTVWKRSHFLVISITETIKLNLHKDYKPACAILVSLIRVSSQGSLESFKWPSTFRVNSEIVWSEWFSLPLWPCILWSYSADLHLCFSPVHIAEVRLNALEGRKLLSPTHTDVLILPVLECLFNTHLNDFMGSYVALDLIRQVRQGSLF